MKSIQAKLLNFFYCDLQKNVDFSDLTLEEVKEFLSDLKTMGYGWDLVDQLINGVVDSDYYRASEILKTCLNATDSDFNDLDIFEYMDYLEEINNFSGDNYIDLPCGECRVIHETDIDDIWHDELIQTFKECYDLSNIPDFICIDWDATADNCKVDGKGHHFASYDHEEHYCNGYFIFRTN